MKSFLRPNRSVSWPKKSAPIHAPATYTEAATPICPAVSSIPLPFSVIRDATEPTIVTSSPSRIQTVPRPMTTSQWNLDQGNRSSRAGIRVSIVSVWTLMAPNDYPPWASGETPSCARGYSQSMLSCTILGHRPSFAADGTVMRWRCRRCGETLGQKEYPTPADARRYAQALNREDSEDLGARAPLIGLLPLRLARLARRRRGR